ncbi:LysR family transcriptional regulator [Streptomyces sioyaensis]|uniref:LysR family transcriptional regulator n=1 Tax=Streptomyces sioyaensis TaxID=67364 RepID=UPI00366592A7
MTWAGSTAQSSGRRPCGSLHSRHPNETGMSTVHMALGPHPQHPSPATGRSQPPHRPPHHRRSRGTSRSPSQSPHLNRLEEDLGQPLFERAERGRAMKLTRFGKRVAAAARTIPAEEMPRR